MSLEEKHKFRSLMKGYRVTKAFASELHTWGLQLIKTKNHIKIIRVDGIGGPVFLAATPSDHRAGCNAAALLIQLLDL